MYSVTQLKAADPFLLSFLLQASKTRVEAVEDNKKDTTLHLGTAVRFLQ